MNKYSLTQNQKHRPFKILPAFSLSLQWSLQINFTSRLVISITNILLLALTFALQAPQHSMPIWDMQTEQSAANVIPFIQHSFLQLLLHRTHIYFCCFFWWCFSSPSLLLPGTHLVHLVLTWFNIKLQHSRCVFKTTIPYKQQKQNLLSSKLL